MVRFTFTVNLYDSANAFLALSATAGDLLFSNVPLDYGDQMMVNSDGFGDYQLPCFAAGTRVCTPRGEVAVRRLVMGGHVLALDHPGLHGGWHDPEPGLRWTSGAAALPLVRHVSLEFAAIGPCVRGG